MFIGLFLFALGVTITIKANVGYAPWEVLHVGLGLAFSITIGTASIIAGLAILLVALALGEKFGLGTIANMVVIGLFIDLILALDIIPAITDNFAVSVVMLVAGLFTISIGSYFYMKSGFGAGPRDSLMVALTRRTKLPVGVCRGGLELLATVSGWLLGGMVGPGTVIAVILIGFCIQITFMVFRFDAAAVKQETFAETFAALIKK